MAYGSASSNSCIVRPVRNKDGEILSKTEDQLKIWKEHFEELFNLPAPVDLPELRTKEDLEHLDIVLYLEHLNGIKLLLLL